MLAERPWDGLRRARGLGKMLAKRLRVKQPSVVKVEKRTDIRQQSTACYSFCFVSRPLLECFD